MNNITYIYNLNHCNDLAITDNDCDLVAVKLEILKKGYKVTKIVESKKRELYFLSIIKLEGKTELYIVINNGKISFREGANGACVRIFYKRKSAAEKNATLSDGYVIPIKTDYDLIDDDIDLLNDVFYKKAITTC